MPRRPSLLKNPNACEPKKKGPTLAAGAGRDGGVRLEVHPHDVLQGAVPDLGLDLPRVPGRDVRREAVEGGAEEAVPGRPHRPLTVA